MATHSSILPGESHGQRSLVGYGPWGHKESDRMERLSTSTHKVPNKEGWVPKKTLESPLDSRRSNQSILKEINPEYSLEGLMLKLKLHYFGHLMWRADSLEKTLMLGMIEGRKRKRWQRIRWLDVITSSVDMSLSKLQGIVKDREAWHAVVHGVTNSGTWLSNWTQPMCLINSCSLFYILNLHHLRNLSWLWVCELFATCGWNSMNNTVLEHTCVSLILTTLPT